MVPACVALALGPGGCWIGLSDGDADRAWQLAPTADVGWPVNRLGMNAAARRRFGREDLAVTLGGEGALHAAANDLGLPGPRVSAVGQLSVTASLGPVDVGYVPTAYLDSRGTSQPSGAVTVAVRGARADFSMRFENDYLVFLGRDEFRTGSLEAQVVSRSGRWPIGGGFLMQFWTARTPDVDLDWPDDYDLDGQLGDGRSHGILCLSVTVGPVFGCLGVDAEPFRDAVQNRFVHRFMDAGEIPPVDRPIAPFVRVSLNRGRASY